MPYGQSSVDEQVVKMAFDNSNFDQNISDSIKALDNLDNKLFALNKQDFSGITNSLEKLANVFTVKGQIMFGIFARLGNEIVNVTKRGLNRLTAGIKDGLGEYNQIIDATQTIYQNVKQSGATIDDVNVALDELNDYADKTVYNFGQMTRMIGQFSSAGVSLNKSVSTIKGLANAAALVGANMERAQIAWNAVSRAMSSGKFTNIVWRSLELSGIAGKQFNKVITEVAKANNVVGKSGKNIDQMIKKYGSLRETLREGWLTKDIFAEAMQIMSGDLDEIALKQKGYTQKQIEELTAIANSAEDAATQVKTFKQLIETTGEAIGSGWAQSFRILVGDLEQAKKMFTRISVVINDYIDNNAKIRNKLFEQIANDRGLDGIWKTGRENFQQTIENMMAVVKTFLKSVKVGFLNIFPVERISSAARKVIDVIQKATRALVINKEQLGEDGELLGWDTEHINAVSESIKNLIRFFRGLASAVDIAWMAFSQPLNVIIKRIPFLNNFLNNTNSSIISLLKNLGKFGDKITVARNAIKNTEIFGEVLELIIDNVDELGQTYPILGGVIKVFRNLKSSVSKLKETFEALNIKPLSILLGGLKLILSSILTLINFIFKAIDNAKSKIDWSFLNTPKEIILKILKLLSDYGRGLVSFKDITEKIGNAINNSVQKISSVFDNIKIHKNFKVVSVDMGVSCNQLTESTNKFGNAITGVWTKIAGFFQPIKVLFDKIKNSSDFTLDGISKKIALIGGGVAAATLAIALFVKTIKKIRIIDRIDDILVAGLNVIKSYQREMQSKMILNIALAIGILAASMAALAFIPYDKLENGLVIFSSFMAVLAMTLTPIITAMAKFNNSLVNTRKQIKELTQLDVLNNLVKELGSVGRYYASALDKKMIGEMVKDIAMSLFILVGAVAALVLLFKQDGDTTKKALISLGIAFGVLAIGIAGLIAEVELLSRSAKTTQTSVNAFSSFFKLSGVARVILAISASVVILVGALALMTKLDSDRLNDCYFMLFGLVSALGVISMVMAGIATQMDSVGKFKKLTISLGGAIIGIAAVLLAMKPLIEAIDNSRKNSWAKALIMVTAIIAQFTAMSVILMNAAKILGANDLAWSRLTRYILSMSVCVGAIAGITALLGYVKPIDPSIIATLITLTTAFGILASLLSLIAIVASRGTGIFAGGFAITITSIAIALASIVSSFGILAAGVAAVIAAINEVDTSDLDTKEVSKGLVKKLEKIADSISEALPKLSKLFYSIGRSIGSMVTYFIKGFADSIINMGDTYDKLADKIVNLALNVLKKVVTALHSRKEEIATIVRQVLDLIGGIITAVVASFFKKNDGSGLFTQEQIMGLIGVVGITSAAVKLITVFAKMSKALAATSAATKAATAYNGFFAASLGDILLAFGAIIAAVEAVEGAYHALRQHWGEETVYINTDIRSIGDAISHLFTDEKFTKQVWIFGLENVGLKIVSGFMAVFKAIASGLAWIAEFFIGTILQGAHSILYAVMQIMKAIDPAHNDVYKKIIKKSEEIAYSFQNAAKSLYNSGKEDFKFAFSFDTYTDPNLKIETYKDAKEVMEYAQKGGVDGWNEGNDILKDVADTCYNVIGEQKEIYEEHSPSKISEDIYHNLMLGAINGLNLGKEALEKKTKELADREVYLFRSGAVKAEEAWQDIFKTTGFSGSDDRIRNLMASVYDTRSGKKYEQVQLNSEMVDLINEQADALEGLNREQARNFLLNKMRAEGLKTDAAAIEEMQFTLEAFYSNSTDSAILHTEQIKKFAQGTVLSVLDVAGKSAAAEELVIQDTYKRYYSVWQLAEENKEILVGKKKEEVQEILKEEAKKAGLTAAEAEDTARMVAGAMFAGKKTEEEITKQGLESQLKANELEYAYYERTQYAKTKLLEKEYEVRNKLAETQAMIQAKFESGEWSKTGGNYLAWIQSSEGKAYQNLQNQHNKLVNEYKNTIKAQQDSLKKLYTDAGMSSENAGRKLASDYEKALQMVNKAATRKGGGVISKIQSVLSGFGKMLGLNAEDPDLTYWNTPDASNKNKLNDNDAVQAASDLKSDLEKQRADLTPIFDLDKLASDANKANGIVMSSLMAAQNASIGDYINKDSELNPFMKDRWQNVYNFTQNNYSPKALSRIDIYRQTQRQISMSRGF